MDARSRAQGPLVALVVAPDGFRDEEWIAPRSRLLAAGFSVVTGCRASGAARGMLGATARCEALVSDLLERRGLAGLVFVGGDGAPVYWDDPRAHALAASVLDAGGVVSAICLGTGTLARAGLLRGRRATGFPSAAAVLASEGAYVTGAPVEIDGRVVTGRDPGSSEEFADTLVRLLSLSSVPAPGPSASTERSTSTFGHSS